MSNAFQESLSKWAQDYVGDAATVTNVSARGYDPGGCETCGSDIEITVQISGKKADGSSFYSEVSDYSFFSLLNDLLKQ